LRVDIHNYLISMYLPLHESGVHIGLL
jgi:hypothetical protein